MRRIALACLFSLTALPAAAQSWCNAASLNLTEKTICADEILRDLDVQMTELYHQRKSPSVTSAQNKWRAQRNRCGGDIYCIEHAYDQRIADLQSAYQAPVAKRRPWCGSSRLNPTERAICGDDQLANLDAALGAIYGNVLARKGDSVQTNWLRKDRDACGADRLCIADSYVRRIMALGADVRALGK